MSILSLATEKVLGKIKVLEYPNRLDPQNPIYAEETSPSVIVNGFSERLRASHIQRIRPHLENLVGSRPRSVPVQLAWVNSHSLFVGIQTYAATLEISVAVSQETGSQPPSGSSNSTL